MNETVQKFIEEFETVFSEILESTPRQKSQDLITEFFRVKNDRPKRRYSDWDIATTFIPGSLTPTNIMKVDQFIKAFKGFNGAGCFLSAQPGYKRINQHVDSLDLPNYLHFMAFMPNETRSPFIDIHLLNIDAKNVKTVYFEKDDNEIREWSMLTAWRKLKNEDLQGSSYAIQKYVIPGYPQENMVVRNDPELFFNDKLAGTAHRSAVAFLNS